MDLRLAVVFAVFGFGVHGFDVLVESHDVRCNNVQRLVQNLAVYLGDFARSLCNLRSCVFVDGEDFVFHVPDLRFDGGGVVEGSGHHGS